MFLFHIKTVGKNQGSLQVQEGNKELFCQHLKETEFGFSHRSDNSLSSYY